MATSANSEVAELRAAYEEAMMALRDVVECLESTDLKRLNLAPALAHADALLARWRGDVDDGGGDE